MAASQMKTTLYYIEAIENNEIETKPDYIKMQRTARCIVKRFV